MNNQAIIMKAIVMKTNKVDIMSKRPSTSEVAIRKAVGRLNRKLNPHSHKGFDLI